ncbi:MAG TPA: hypothetical protein VFE96_07115 [Candidatus Bathyarchaeia archaeon]|jgi:hypothetical protein|nr:hypothetical protein [Candidatus Bathyarchaeia archaeon]
MTTIESERPLAQAETRIALIHRVIIPDEDYPKEYGILITDRRSIFIRLEKTRNSFALRGEMRYGTALITDVEPKTLRDYEGASADSLATNVENLAIPHENVLSLTMKKDLPKPRWYEFFVRLTMRMQREDFQVYNFELEYRGNTGSQTHIKFYMVPLGAYFKPKRQTQTRDTILREYAMEALSIFQKVLPGKTKPV